MVIDQYSRLNFKTSYKRTFEKGTKVIKIRQDGIQI